MDYQKFLGAVEHGMNERLSDDITVNLHTTVKNNGLKKQGITIVKKDVNISPTIYLEEFYRQYQNGRSMDEILKRIDHFYHEVRYEKSLDTDVVQSYDWMKDKVFFKLINKEKNQELLKMVPYMEYQDMVLVFYILLDVQRGGTATMTVTNAMMEKWNVSEQKLYDLSQRNGKRAMQAVFRPMGEVLEELMCICPEEGVNEYMEKDEEMYVLTNELRSFGAAVMAYDYVLDMVAEQLKSSFYILPSSVHEVIVVSVNSDLSREELDETIHMVNETQVEAEEILENHCYIYDRVDKTLYF